MYTKAICEVPPLRRFTNVLYKGPKRGAGPKIMLNMQIEPTMCMKTNGSATKWLVIYESFLPNLHRFCENGRKSIGLWLKMYCDHLGSGGGGAGLGGVGPNLRNGVAVPKFLFGSPDLSEAVKAPFRRRAHRWGWTQASMGR